MIYNNHQYLYHSYQYRSHLSCNSIDCNNARGESEKCLREALHR